MPIGHSRIRCLGRIAFLLILCGLFVSQAQVSTGSVAGQVTDPSGAAVPGATVTVVNQGTGVDRSIKTDASGGYVFPAAAAGLYTIRAESPGFRSFQVKGLEVQVAQAVRRDIQLTIGETSTQLEVIASAPVLDERTAEVGQVIGTRETGELPLNGRNYFELSKLAPGVTELAGSSQSNGLAINGQRANQISFYFDGVDTRTEISGKPAFTPSIEAIQEFKIQENSFSAEYGRNPAAINVSLKPGANAFHGALFEFLRNDTLDARSFFSSKVDSLRRNQFGGVLSGPVLHNKTFFMVNYEGLRTRSANTLYLSVPSAAQRAGDFSATAAIYDPATLDTTTGKRQPFAGNVIPATRISTIGTSALKYYPSATSTGSAYNYIVSSPTISDGDQFHGRIDHVFNERDVLFGRLSYTTSNANSPGGLPYTATLEDTKGVNLTVQETHTFSATTINQLRLAWTYFNDLSVFPTLDHNATQSEFSLLNLSPPSTAYGVPQLNVTGLSSLGANAYQPAGPRENIYTLADDFSWIRGRHALKFGFDGRYYRPSVRVAVTPNGMFTFADQFTNQPGVSGTGSAIADLLLGAPSNVRATQLAETNAWASLKYYFYGFFAQDEFRVNPKLTLNIGLRYEYQTPYDERFHELGVFDLATTTFRMLGKDISGLSEPDRNNFAPRIGAAYSLNSKTVIRSGFGVFYGEPRGSEFSSFQLSPPFVLDKTITSSALVPDVIGQAFPTAQVRDSSGNVLVTSSTNVFSLERPFRTNYTYQWTFNVQRELAHGWLFEAGYLGNSAHKLTGRELANQAIPDANPSTAATSIASRRPNPSVGDVSYVSSIDNSNYHGLSAKLDKRFGDGLSIIGSYTYSKAMGIGGNLFGDQSRQQDRRNRREEYAALDFNQTQRLTLAWVYELPFGKGKPIGSSLTGVKGLIATGWSVQGIYTAHTGFPLSPASATSVNVGRADANRPNRICDGNLSSGQRITSRWFNTSCFSDHAFGVFGNSGNNILIGPGTNDVNLTAMKNTALHFGAKEAGTVQFRAEFFNAFNHAIFGDPGLTVGTSQFGVISSVRTPGRQIQLALKYIF